MSSLPLCSLCHQPLPASLGTTELTSPTLPAANVAGASAAVDSTTDTAHAVQNFFANTPYSVVPSSPLQLIVEGIYARWYVVFTGFYVGIFNDLDVYNKAIIGAPGALGRRFPTQVAAAAAFNSALLSNQVRVAKVAVSAQMAINFSNDSPGMPLPQTSPTNAPTTPMCDLADELENAFGRLQISDRTVYEVSSSTFNGVTHDWHVSLAVPLLSYLLVPRSTASHATQKEPGSHVRATVKRSKNRQRAVAYAVFIGRFPGVYTDWSDVKESVDGVPSACFQGYSSTDFAEAAFLYAHRHGRSWVQSICETRPFVRPRYCYHAHHPHSHPDNPLSEGSTARKRFYVVYKGRVPGVYTTWLETHIETTGLSGASHESFASLPMAIEKYHAAEARYELRRLPEY
ncbi:hypothetical protein ONZ45_g16731 [Pleurotus djamor]|nr:hypothetical protein ONZ45_g16731 [Pleurotus djamor]